MGITATILIYLLIGLEVAEAVFLADDRQESVELAFRMVTAVVFWPLYVALLLQTDEQPPVDAAAVRLTSSVDEHDEPSANIQAQTESVIEESASAISTSRAG